jgi:voltage-gated potassium channel
MRWMVPIGSLVTLLFFGTMGFRIIEGWGWWDSFYMVLISITTVGYGEVHPLSRPGQMFASCVILSGIGVGSYVLLVLTRTFFEGVVEGSLQAAYDRRRMERELPKLIDHTIVCGYGRLGREICLALAAEWRVVVVIEPDTEAYDRAREDGFHAVHGDASDEAVLRTAGIDRASSIAVATSGDAINTYVVLSAKEMRPDLLVLSRADDDVAAKRLRRAGADQVVAPTQIGGQRMAHMLLRPGVVDFLDLAQLGDFPDLFIEELLMHADASLAEQTIIEADYSKRWKVLVLAIKKADGSRVFRPPAQFRVASGDKLIVAGHREDLEQLQRSMGPS